MFSKKGNEHGGLRSRGCGFEPHWRHCAMFLSKTLYPLLSKEDLPDRTEKMLTRM